MASDAFGLVVPYGKLLVLNPSPPEYMYVSECTALDRSNECAVNNFKGQSTFEIRFHPDDTVVVGATVTGTITFGVVGQTPTYTQSFSEVTNALGKITVAMPACVLRPSNLACVIKATVEDVVKNVPVPLVYNPAENVCTSTEIQVPEIAVNPCDYVTFPITPKPAAFMSSSPFQQQMSGSYYHIMVAVVATNTSGCVEYKFTCVDDDSKSSGWRSTANVAGTYYPNGTAQVPQQYWALVGGKNQRYYWKVQYRACGCANGDTESAPKQVPAIP